MQKFVFINMNIFINCKCLFLSELCLLGNFENTLLSFGSRLERYLKAWDLPQNGKFYSSPATVLAGNVCFMVFLKKYMGTDCGIDFPGTW